MAPIIRRKLSPYRLLLVVAAGIAVSMQMVRAQVLSGASVTVNQGASETTLQRIREPGWWPTKGDAPRKEYVGTAACEGCHAKEVRNQQQTSMARAAWRGPETTVLRATPKISLDMPPFTTAITRERKGSTYSVARGGEGISGQVLWAMGDGTMGQTFILNSEAANSGGSLFESQLSYFASIQGLDLTPGHTRGVPQDLQRAFGERQSTETAQLCFGCHTTASTVKRQFDQAHATPGITCEACHGPGANHAEAMSQGRIEDGKAAILNPRAFEPEKLIDYCGACHRTPMDVAATKDFVPINVRFQPYRLAKSRCWSKPDARISCTGCHNPHEQVVRDSAFYDAKCLACHAAKLSAPVVGTAQGLEHEQSAAPTTAGKSSACPVGTSRCTTCHMPSYKVPQMHGSFTDHDIRVVRSGDAFPL